VSAESTPRSSAASIAYEALNLGKQNARDIENHEDICAERYANINKGMAKIESNVDKQFGEIKGILKWAGGALFSIIIGLLGYLAAAQFSANDIARKASDAKIDLLERQLLQQTPVPRAPPPSHP